LSLNNNVQLTSAYCNVVSFALFTSHRLRHVLQCMRGGTGVSLNNTQCFGVKHSFEFMMNY